MLGIGIKGRFAVIAHREAGMGVLVGAELRRAIRTRAAKIVFRRHNLVVNQGLEALLAILGNGAGAPTIGATPIASANDLCIGTMQLGDTVGPSAPSSTDTTGVQSLVVSGVPTVTYDLTTVPNEPEITFSLVVNTGAYPTTVFTEEALRCNNGLVFAKVAPVSYPMASVTGYQFNHTLIMSRV